MRTNNFANALSTFAATHRFWLCLLTLVAWVSFGCSAEPPAATPASVFAGSARPLPKPSACDDDALRLGREALAEGRLLRARHHLEKASVVCPKEATRELKLVAEQIAAAQVSTEQVGSTAQGSTNEHLSQAAAARASREPKRAYGHEAAAVVALEQQAGEALRVSPRALFEASEWSREGRYLLLTGRERVSVIDSQSGALVARVPRLEKPGERGQYHPEAKRLVQLAVGELPCILQVAIFDTTTGTLAKRLCGTDWSFNREGTRLAVSEIHGMADGAIMSLAVLDAQSLEVVSRFQRPGTGQGNITTLVPSSDGTKVAVKWATGMSVVDLNTAQSWQVEGRPFGLSAQRSFDARLSWTEDGKVFVWDPFAGNGASGVLTSWSMPDCPRPTLALSPSEDRMAIGCGKVVWFWKAGSAPATARRMNLEHTVFNLRWFGHGGALLVRHTDDAPQDFTVVDPRTRRLIRLTGKGERLERVALATGLVHIAAADGGASRIVRVESDGSTDDFSLSGCRLWDEDIDENNGTAVASCDRDGGTWLFRADGSAPRRLPLPLAGRLTGQALVHVDLGTVELWSAEDGSLLSGSPGRWLPHPSEGYWDGKEFVLSWGHLEPTASVQFEPSLSVSYEHAFVDECDGVDVYEHRGRYIWGRSSPYPLCDRRSGKVLGHLPFPAKPEQFSNADVSEDGRYFLAQQRGPKLFELSSGRAVSLKEDPEHLQFAGALLVGYTKKFYGVWDPASGRVLARFAKPSQLPMAVSSELELAVTPHSNVPRLYGFPDGKHLADLNAELRTSAQFGHNDVLSILESGWVSFWRLPNARKLAQNAKPVRLGRLLFHEHGVVLLTAEGGFDWGGELPKSLLRCEVGLFELPIDICIEALGEPGAATALVH